MFLENLDSVSKLFSKGKRIGEVARMMNLTPKQLSDRMRYYCSDKFEKKLNE
jgi:hypothetical protein